MGADITATEDGMIIHGGHPLHGANIQSHDDHRIAMALAIAAMNSEGPVEISGADCIRISYPEFFHGSETADKCLKIRQIYDKSITIPGSYYH